jgi:hypothetical protein
MTEALGYIVLALWLIISIVGALEGVNPFEDRPRGYIFLSFLLEIGLVWLALKVVL